MLWKSIAILFLAVVSYLCFWPTDLDPLPYKMDKDLGFTGVFSDNSLLGKAERVGIDGEGPEDIAISDEGWAYMGLQDGRIVRVSLITGKQEDYAHTQGRPLGLAFDHQGALIVADAYKGLLRLKQKESIEILATESDGVPFGFTDDVDVAPDGKIYFTDASHKFSQARYKEDGFEHRPNGRLLVYDPKTNMTTTLLADLYFANGVAVSQNGEYLLFNETWKYRVQKYWLQGPSKGKAEVLLDNLPGFPDGISRGDNGVYWLAIISPRSKILDLLGPWPNLRKVVGRLPGFLQPAMEPYAGVFGLNGDGLVVYNFQDPGGMVFANITSVEEKEGKLFFGSLVGDAFGIYDPQIRVGTKMIGSGASSASQF